MIEKFIHRFFFLYFHRNAFRTDAGEDRTVPHTVPLRGGSPQKHACAYCVWHKIFSLDSWRRVTADIQTHTAMKLHTGSHGVLCHILDACSRIIFQILRRIYYWTENRICCISEADVSFLLVLHICWM